MYATARSFALYASAVVASACNLFVSQDVRSARHEVSSHVAFVRPVTGGYEVAAPDGRVGRVAQTGSRDWVSSLTPDLSGYSYIVSARDRDSSTSRRKVTFFVQLPGLEPVAALSTETEKKNISRKLAWASPDGSSFLIQLDGTLQSFSRCNDAIQRKLIAEGVQSFTVAYEILYFLKHDEPGNLFWKRAGIDGRMENGILKLDSAFSGLVAGGDDDHLLGFRASRSRSSVRENLALIDIKTGRSHPINLPVDAEIFDFVHLRDKPAIVAEIWIGGMERLDGTELTQFYVWDYLSGEATRLFKNHKFYQLHSLSPNVQTWPLNCD